MNQRTDVPAEFRDEPNKATEKQVNFIRDLLNDKFAPRDEKRLEAEERIDSLTKKQASAWIDRLLKLPNRPRDRSGAVGANVDRRPIPTAEELPAGRYAVDNEDGELRFYKVWRGSRRPDYFKLYVEHGPDESEVPFKAALTILGKIIDTPGGPLAAAMKYGHEIGACYACGRRLTNRLSRELGIGPVCGGRGFGDEFNRLKAEAREQIEARGEDPDEEVSDREPGNPDPSTLAPGRCEHGALIGFCTLGCGSGGTPIESPPCMACGRSEHTHVPGECVR